jgi:hypothetical protein
VSIREYCDRNWHEEQAIDEHVRLMLLAVSVVVLDRPLQRAARGMPVVTNALEFRHSHAPKGDAKPMSRDQIVHRRLQGLSQHRRKFMFSGGFLTRRQAS